MSFNMYRKSFTIIISLMLFHLVSFAREEKRLALVIGNSEYTSGRLNNAVNDANKVSAKLKTLGFDVMLKNNASNQAMGEIINDFTDKATNYDVALFYYAGHGIQSEGSNYLIPVNDNLIKKESDIEYNSQNVNRLLRRLEDSGCRLKIIILDACRNNPFERSWHRSASSTGLAFLTAPDGTLIAYATSPGSVADDGGNAQNSPYTTAFLQTLDKTELTIFEFFNEVGSIVRRNTNNKQTPWLSTSPIEGNFKFNQSTIVESEKSITFNLSPSNATIKFGNTTYKNGQTLTFKMGSAYSCVIEANGYQSQTRRFTVDQSTPSSMNVSLRKVVPAVTSTTNAGTSLPPSAPTKVTTNKKSGTDSGMSSLRLLENDFTAKTNSIYDQNGQLTALIKIFTTAQGLYFSIGDHDVVKTERKGEGEIWIYVPQGATAVTVMNRHGSITSFLFDAPFEGGKTYELKLDSRFELAARVSEVKGCVMDAKTMEPIIGASVLVVGTNLGAATDIDGKFTIKNVPDSATTLNVCYIGYITKEEEISPEDMIVLMVPEKRRWRK